MADDKTPATSPPSPPDTDRRRFLRVLGAGAAGGALAAAASACGTAPRIEPAEGPRRRYGMIIDLRRCVKCESCTIACKAENNVPVDSSRMPSRRIFWNHLFYEEEGGERPTIHATPQPCNHCEEPPCTKVCPVGATYRDESRGLVLINYDTCIGCRYCTVACPYTRRYFNWEEPRFPHRERTGAGTMSQKEGGANPMVAVRTKGVTEKCTFCVQRILAAENRARREGRRVRDGEIQPACVATCIARARIFGDLNDPDSEISRLSEQYEGRLVRLEEHLGTRPKAMYIPEV
jgi:molybdopterin-containing oxidoreductase family iron-sulfur binding subunit